MSRTHGRADIYLNGELAHELGIVIEQPTVNRIQVKTRRADRPSGWVVAVTMESVVYVGRDRNVMRWAGLVDGVETELTMVPRSGGGCSSCGG